MDANKIIEEALQCLRQYQVADDADWAEAYIANNSIRLKGELDYVLQNIPATANRDVLEYGSAPFWFTTALKIAGYNVVGTDLAPERFNNFEKLGLKILRVNYDTEPLPMENDSVDAIICNEVFEHMRHNLIFTFKEAHRVLKPGGELHITTPNLLSAQGYYNLLVRQLGYSCADDLFHEWNKIEEIGHMGHVREYTSREVSLFLTKVGFKVERVNFFSLPPKGRHQKFFHQFGRILPRLKQNMRVLAVK